MAGVIDGRRWLRQRIQQLEKQLSEEEMGATRRAQLESELALARAELRQERRRRWLLWGSRP